MASTWPGAPDTFVDPEVAQHQDAPSLVGIVKAIHRALEAVQGNLGVDAQGGWETIAERLNGVDNAFDSILTDLSNHDTAIAGRIRWRGTWDDTGETTYQVNDIAIKVDAGRSAGWVCIVADTIGDPDAYDDDDVSVRWNKMWDVRGITGGGSGGGAFEYVDSGVFTGLTEWKLPVAIDHEDDIQIVFAVAANGATAQPAWMRFSAGGVDADGNDYGWQQDYSASNGGATPATRAGVISLAGNVTYAVIDIHGLGRAEHTLFYSRYIYSSGTSAIESGHYAGVLRTVDVLDGVTIWPEALGIGTGDELTGEWALYRKRRDAGSGATPGLTVITGSGSASSGTPFDLDDAIPAGCRKVSITLTSVIGSTSAEIGLRLRAAAADVTTGYWGRRIVRRMTDGTAPADVDDQNNLGEDEWAIGRCDDVHHSMAEVDLYQAGLAVETTHRTRYVAWISGEHYYGDEGGEQADLAVADGLSIRTTAGTIDFDYTITVWPWS